MLVEKGTRILAVKSEWPLKMRLGFVKLSAANRYDTPVLATALFCCSEGWRAADHVEL